jgi:restriction system protein
MNQLPKYHEAFIPVLKVLNDSGIIHYTELERRVRDKYYNDLPKELLEQKTKSGHILILNRIGWARAYLKQAEMVSQPERAMVQITEKGKMILASGQLTLKQLLTDVDFLKNRNNHKRTKNEEDKNEVVNENSSPEDMIEIGVDSIENQVKSELLKKLRIIDPYYFEKVVLKLFSAMGYGDFITTSKSGDGGIDGIINQDQLGLEKIYIQTKRYAENNKIREPLIRDFIGAMSGDTKKGIFVTTSFFDESAIKKAKEAHHTIKLIDGEQLVDLMHRYNIGVQAKDIYEIKQIDEDFFSV